MPEITHKILDKAAKVVGNMELSDSIYTLMVVRDSLETSEWLKLLDILNNPTTSDLDVIHELGRKS